MGRHRGCYSVALPRPSMPTPPPTVPGSPPESWQERAVRASPVAMAQVIGQKYQDVNRAFCELVGHPREALIGADVYGVVAPEDRERVGIRHHARLRGDAAPEEYELVVLR